MAGATALRKRPPRVPGGSTRAAADAAEQRYRQTAAAAPPYAGSGMSWVELVGDDLIEGAASGDLPPRQSVDRHAERRRRA